MSFNFNQSIIIQCASMRPHFYSHPNKEEWEQMDLCEAKEKGNTQVKTCESKGCGLLFYAEAEGERFCSDSCAWWEAGMEKDPETRVETLRKEEEKPKDFAAGKIYQTLNEELEYIFLSKVEVMEDGTLKELNGMSKKLHPFKDYDDWYANCRSFNTWEEWRAYCRQAIWFCF